MIRIRPPPRLLVAYAESRYTARLTMLFFNAYIIFLLAVMSPGPDFLVTIRNSIHSGRAAGIKTATGIALANSVHMMLINLGLAAWLTQSGNASRILEALAALYLAYLGIHSWILKPAPAPDSTPAASGNAEHRSPLLQGLLVNLFNVKAILFWLSFFSLVLPRELPVAARVAILVFLVIHIFGWFSAVAILMSRDAIRRRFLARQSFFNRLMAVFLLVLAGRVAYSLFG